MIHYKNANKKQPQVSRDCLNKNSLNKKLIENLVKSSRKKSGCPPIIMNDYRFFSFVFFTVPYQKTSILSARISSNGSLINSK